MNQQSRNNKKNAFYKVCHHNLKDYVNFQMQEDQIFTEQPKRAAQKLTTRQIQQRQELYMKSKFQFVVLQNQQAQLDVKWDDVQQIIYATVHEITCPICMSDTFEIVVPHMTACGHIYCLPCYFRHTLLSKNNHKCPLCGEFIIQSEMRSVHLVRQKLRVLGEPVKMIQLSKAKKSNLIFDNRTKIESKAHTRTLKVNKAYIKDMLCTEIEQLQNVLEICDEECKQSVQKSIQFIIARQDLLHFTNKDQQLSQIVLQEQSVEGDDVGHVFYQDESGQLGFLHPLCNKYLQIQYNDKQLQDLECKIVKIDKFTQNENTLKRYKFLSHIPLYTDILFYELDIASMLSKNNYQDYQYELSEYRSRQQRSVQASNDKHNRKQSDSLQEALHKQQQYHYTNNVNDSFEFNADDFPELSQQSSKVSQPSENTEFYSQKILEQINDRPPTYASVSEELAHQFKEDQQFPGLAGSQSMPIPKEPTGFYSAQNQFQQPAPPQKQQNTKIELDFLVVNKKSRQRGKYKQIANN